MYRSVLIALIKQNKSNETYQLYFTKIKKMKIRSYMCIHCHIHGVKRIYSVHAYVRRTCHGERIATSVSTDWVRRKQLPHAPTINALRDSNSGAGIISKRKSNAKSAKIAQELLASLRYK